MPAWDRADAAVAALSKRWRKWGSMGEHHRHDASSTGCKRQIMLTQGKSQKAKVPKPESQILEPQEAEECFSKR